MSSECDDPRDVLAEMEGVPSESVDALAAVRLGFLQKLLVTRSEAIDPAADTKARQDRPEDERRYEMLVDAVERANEDGGLF